MQEFSAGNKNINKGADQWSEQWVFFACQEFNAHVQWNQNKPRQVIYLVSSIEYKT